MFEHPGDDSSSSETCAARCSRLTHLGHVTRRRSTQQSHNFVQPVLNLSSFLRGRGWLWWCWCMCLESKYLIGFKILSWVLVCVCACVRWAAAWWQITSPVARRNIAISQQIGKFLRLQFTRIYNLQCLQYFHSPARPAMLSRGAEPAVAAPSGSCSLHGDIVTSKHFTQCVHLSTFILCE